MEDAEQFDGLYMTVLQKGQGIQNFFDSFFGFLYRKSDFFSDKNKAYEYVESNYKKYQKKFEEKKEKEYKKKRKEEEERKAKEGTASVREITQEEYERRKNEENKIINNKNETPTINTDNSEVTKEEDKIAEGKVKPGPGNGGVTDKYSWTQHDIKEIGISIPIPSNIRGRDVNVKYDSKSILIEIKGLSPLISGEFYLPIKPDSFLWSIEEVKNGKVITVTFEKMDTYKWWESLVKGEVQIDTSKINPEPSKISDIEDPEMKSQIEKMMFDTKQKQMGLPTSDDLQKQNMLSQFMKSHPEMDFSKCKFG